MLESDEEQCFNNWRNSLVVDRYEREDVWPSLGSEDEHRDQVQILKLLRNDLFNILDNQKGDIREYLADKCGQTDESEIQFSQYLRKAKKMRYVGSAEDSQLIEVTSDADEEKENVQ